jgi:hypothetical protein
MATTTTPSRGQPIDVTLISSLVEAVSDLQNSQLTSTQSRVNSAAANTSALKFYAENRSVTINNITTSPEEKFFFTYPNFTSTPVAVVGLTNTTSTVAGGNAATAVLTSVTKDRVDGVIKFPSGSTGSVTMQINLIAIGIS